MLQVTTSWDDGDVLDTRVADLLTRYSMKGTFYVAQTYRPQRLSESEMRTISEVHEIGAHTLTHPNLTTLSRAEKYEEIAGGKVWLEKVLGKEVPMFCYPSGRYDGECAEVAKEAGFRGARTTEQSRTDIGVNPYVMPTTLHLYPFPFRKTLEGGYYWGKLLQPMFERVPLYRKLEVPYSSMYSWGSVARAAFDHALAHGEVFHLWGHSWELDRYDLWDDFESILSYVSQRKECAYVTNGELLGLSFQKHD